MLSEAILKPLIVGIVLTSCWELFKLPLLILSVPNTCHLDWTKFLISLAKRAEPFLLRWIPFVFNDCSSSVKWQMTVQGCDWLNDRTVAFTSFLAASSSFESLRGANSDKPMLVWGQCFLIDLHISTIFSATSWGLFWRRLLVPTWTTILFDQVSVWYNGPYLPTLHQQTISPPSCLSYRSYAILPVVK